MLVVVDITGAVSAQTSSFIFALVVRHRAEIEGGGLVFHCSRKLNPVHSVTVSASCISVH